jgi:lycopene cyclase domain-containing protein
MATYLIINLSSVLIPFIFSFHQRLRFHQSWYAFWPATLLTGGIFIVWDIFFTRWGVWGFTPRHLIGQHLLGLPIEEWLFFICIPYACVFTYASLKKLMANDFLAAVAGKATFALASALALVAVFHLDKLYTSVTFLATAAFLLMHLLFIRSAYLGRFYFSYCVILLPFLLVNGILTGSFIDGEVVWYNDAENLGIRIFTIPVEDFVYALLLILMNVTIFEALLRRQPK